MTQNNNGPIKICEKQPLKKFTWSILEYFVSYNVFNDNILEIFANLVYRNVAHVSPVHEFMRSKLLAVVKIYLIFVTITKLGYKQDEIVRSKQIASKFVEGGWLDLNFYKDLILQPHYRNKHLKIEISQNVINV